MAEVKTSYQNDLHFKNELLEKESRTTHTVGDGKPKVP